MSFPLGIYPNAPYTRLMQFLYSRFSTYFSKVNDRITEDIKSINGIEFYKDRVFLPQTSFQNEGNISMIPTNFIKYKLEGRIIGKLATVTRIIDGNTVQLDTSEQLSVDLIIVASDTGCNFHSFPNVFQKD